MKDILGKLSAIEAAAPKKSKKILTEASSSSLEKPDTNSLKSVFETMVAGQKPIPVVGKQGDTQQTGAGFLNITDPALQGLGKALGDLAAQKKIQMVVPTQPGQQQGQQSGQPAQAGVTGQPQPGQMQMKEKDEGKPGKNFAKIAKKAAKEYGSKAAGERVAGAVRAKLAKQGKLEEESDTEKTAKDTKKAFPNVKHLTKSGNPDWKKHGFKDMPVKEGAKVDRMVKHIEKSEREAGKPKDKAEDIAWATVNKRGYLDNKNKKKVKEADIPSSQGIDTRGAGLGAGRSATTLEGKKPDFLDLDKDGNRKEPMKKAAADKKKQKVKESMNHRISAARLEGKSHGLKGHAHCGKNFEDLEERKAYCEGYKDGLDECYGMGVYEAAPAIPAATVGGMAHDEMGEGNAFTTGLARTPRGGQFKVGGKTFTDRTGYDSPLDEMDLTFESWDKQLSKLINEGLSVSVSKGNENAPDSVNINATDADADQLLALVKSAGLGLFGKEEEAPVSSAMSVQPVHGEPDEVGAVGTELDVVDGSDDMLSLMKKLGGVEASGANDYAEEEPEDSEAEVFIKQTDMNDDEEETSESACNECGMMEAECHCDDQPVEEETEDQREFKVAEDNAPDSGAGETEEEVEDDAESNESAAAYDAAEEDEEEDVAESFFNLLGKLTKLAEAKKDDEYEDENPEEDGPDHGKAWYDTSDELKEESEELNEWANQVGKGPGKGTDASFEQDIEFMTKVIAGGLNKPKSTGQTTVPVIAGQNERTHTPESSTSDSVDDWKKLAGLI